jgi:hypothetical protein
MTDWDLITEYIRSAMEAVDETHRAAEALRARGTPEEFDAFRAEVGELIYQLTKLQTVLDDEKAFGRDELSDWLSRTFTGHPAEYRITPRMERETGC